ncbi:hypothetical protein SAMN03159495_0110 [Pseudomonas sp. NFR16]|nr:hypothetical protein SAMN03159495_0110 [Pseudomonas sp. NFR16]
MAGWFRAVEQNAANGHQLSQTRIPMSHLDYFLCWVLQFGGFASRDCLEAKPCKVREE